MGSAFRSSLLFQMILLLVAVVVVFAAGIGGGFLFDDFPNIVTNGRIHAEVLTWDSLRAAASAYEPGHYGRPLATIGFAVDYAIGGKDPFVFKVHSLLVHGLNALLVFVFVRRLLALAPDAAAWAKWAPLALTLLWAIHPLQVSTVLYIVQRMEMLAATFVLLALLAYLRGRRIQAEGGGGWGWLVGSGLLAGIGMLAKESAVLFPLFALAIEATFLQFAARQPRTQRALRQAYGLGIAVGVLGFVLVLMPQYLAPDAYSSREFTVGERLLTQMRVLPLYLGQMLFPVPGSMPFFYDQLPKSTGWLSPATTIAGALFLAALFAIAWRLRARAPVFAFGVFWFFAAHFLTSNIIRLEMVFEHRNYLALLGVLLAVATLVRRLPVADSPAAARLAAFALVLGVGLLGAIRSANWGEPLLLASQLAGMNPNSARASSDLATLYAGMSDYNANSPFYGMAMAEFDRGSRLPNASPLPEQGLILLSAASGQPARDEWWDRLEQKIRDRPNGPQEAAAVSGLLKQRMEGLPVDDGRLSRVFEVFLEKRKSSAALHSAYAHYLVTVRKDEARGGLYFAKAIAIEGDPVFAQRVVTGLREDGHPEAARAVVEQLMAPSPTPAGN